jgi:general L-amino acid transport system substrate-binding protein
LWLTGTEGHPKVVVAQAGEGASLMTTIFSSLVTILITVLTMAGLTPPASAQATLEAVKKRDKLLCGTNGGLPGFSFQNAQQQWEGIDVDLCRGVAAAVLGDAKKVTFIPTTAQNRFDRLVAGEFDMLARNSTVTLQRATGNRARFAVVNYYDGQAFVVPKKAGIARVSGLSDRIVCVTKGTTHQFNLVAWLKLRGTSALVLTLDTDTEMYKAFFDGRCVAVTADATALAATLITSGKAADYMMLPDFISKEPLGPFVRNGDSPWLDVVRWTHYAMVEAEEREITRNNVDGRRADATDPNVRMLLGVDAGNGKALGLDERWAYNVIKQVGNYSEIFERNVGQASPLGFARGSNALWNKGGLMFALPLR